MLRICLHKLRTIDAERNLAIERVLLHYRALVEFFGGKHHKYEDDLSTADPEAWDDGRLSADNLAKFREIGAKLDDAHFKEMRIRDLRNVLKAPVG